MSIIASGANAKPHILVDMDTGTILSEKDPDHRWYPASLTKLMTAYVTMRAIQAGEIELGSPVTISKAARRQPPSKMGYKEGVQLRVDTALKIIIIKSANDVSLALAEAVSGSLSAFVARMNSEAARLGMTNSRFANANGLHDPKQFTSARDMALLTAQLRKEFPQYSNWFEAVAVRTSAKTHYSYNLLLERLPGTDGMKTGFVCASGYNLVATGRFSDRNLIAVVLGRDSQTDRAVSAAKLLSNSQSTLRQGSIYTPRPNGKAPRNMRPILCTQEARASRYNPTPEIAVIKSEFLTPRNPTGTIIPVSTGGVDADPSEAWLLRKFATPGKVPIPSKRPDYDPVTGKIRLAAIERAETGNIAIPTPRPARP